MDCTAQCGDIQESCLVLSPAFLAQMGVDLAHAQTQDHDVCIFCSDDDRLVPRFCCMKCMEKEACVSFFLTKAQQPLPTALWWSWSRDAHMWPTAPGSRASDCVVAPSILLPRIWWDLRIPDRRNYRVAFSTAGCCAQVECSWNGSLFLHFCWLVLHPLWMSPCGVKDKINAPAVSTLMDSLSHCLPPVSGSGSSYQRWLKKAVECHPLSNPTSGYKGLYWSRQPLSRTHNGEEDSELGSVLCFL
jgi:hypothetical protein